MRNKLFIVCPFCHLEIHLRKKFGNDIFFLTKTAGVLTLESDEISSIKEFIQRNKITDIYLISDTDCNFIDEAINNKRVFGLRAEEQLRRLVQNMLLNFDEEQSNEEKRIIVAETNVRNQASYLSSENVLLREINSCEITIHSLITTKNESIINFLN